MERGAWQATVHGVAKSQDMTEATWHACMQEKKRGIQEAANILVSTDGRMELPFAERGKTARRNSGDRCEVTW